ncbi:MAG: acetate/propionate family kinase [Polyangiaceae bacterium]
MKSALVLNAGSSSLKWAHLEAATGKVIRAESLDWPEDAAAPEALRSLPPADAIGHRFVHGGSAFREACVIDEGVRKTLGEIAELDPLHMPRALAALDAAKKAFPALPQIAAFDTAFHASMPDEAATYAIPFAWTEDRKIRRFGFHGLSVDYSVGKAAELLGAVPEKLVVAHLGSGSSMTAVRDGKSVDTTMGFTPLEGLMMATRSGSVDPGVIFHLLKDLKAEAIEHALEKESGLLGVSGESADLRVVLASADRGAPRAKLAYGMFLHGLKRNLGAMVGALGGLDVLVFTGGIGENSERVRNDLTAAFSFVSPKVLVIVAREDLVVLREMRRLLSPT